MQTRARSTLMVGVSLVLADCACAQTFNSFKLADGLEGLTVETLSPLSYRLTLGSDPVMEFQGQDYPIVDVFGFWALSVDDDLIGSTSDFGVWNSNSNNASTGGILGWRTNPNTGVDPGGSQIFTFDSLETARVEAWGFHVRLDGLFPGTSGNTGHVYVPSPGAALLFGAAGLMASRRRRVTGP